VIDIVPFRPYHVDLLIARGVQPQQQAEASLVLGPYANLPPPLGMALTALEGDKVLMCGGVIPRFPGVGEVWALLSSDARWHLVALTRATRRFLGTQNYRRLEVTAEAGFAPGCRWLEMLGFRPEGPCYNYGPKGEHHLRYSLCRS
jgi:hypothetical protein